MKKITDCLYEKYLDIRRAGNDVAMILKELEKNFKDENQGYDYEYLDREIFKYLARSHEEFKVI